MTLKSRRVWPKVNIGAIDRVNVQRKLGFRAFCDLLQKAFNIAFDAIEHGLFKDALIECNITQNINDRSKRSIQ